LEARVNDKNKRFSHSSNATNISSLAHSALRESKKHLLRPANPEWIEHAGEVLVRHCLSRAFDKNSALQQLLELGFKETSIVDYCIPIAAARLGEAWVNDTLSFAECTLGTSNLQMLVKLISQNREGELNSSVGNRYLICVHEKEQHTLGALVVADILRRKGHSLKVILDANSDEVCHLQKANRYDGIFFSCASYLSIRETAECVKQIRNISGSELPIFLGGGNIEEISEGADLSEFNLVTSSVEAVDEYVKNKIKRQTNTQRLVMIH